MTLELEHIALQYGPVVVLSEARKLQSARARAKDESGRVAGVRDLEQLGAALRLASELSSEERRRLFDAVATDKILALLVRLISDAEQAGAQDPSRIEAAAALRAVLTMLLAAGRPR